MCRISGIISSKPSDTLYQQVKGMCDAMKHGGPDDEGIYLDPDKGIAFGHRRLSLLDLSEAGHQPMAAADEQVWITYNGEVYNFKEIRAELEAHGHIFHSGTDTEVILKAYLQWGTDAFRRFNGMFAFALADLRENENSVYLVRDAVGIKPLYYSVENGELVFASEVKAFKELNPSWKQNPDWRLLLLAFGHIPEPYTTLQNVLSLPKGSFLKYNLSEKNYKIISYRRLNFVPAGIIKKEDALSGIKEQLRAAVKRHLIADAPIGLFLSGGIDSSLLTLLAAKEVKEQLHTLSVTFNEDKFSEKEYQQLIIEQAGCKHRFFEAGIKDLEDNLENIIRAYDQPSNDAVNSWFISKCAKESGLKAVLSGLGSDEVFGGYPSFNRIAGLQRLQKLPAAFFRTAALIPDKRMRRLQWLTIPGNTGLYLAMRGFFSPAEIAKIAGLSPKEVINRIAAMHFQPEERVENPDEQACWLEFNRYMQNQLLKDSDYMSMQHGLELRVPFLDQEFLDTIFRIDRKLLYQHGGLPKQLLIDAFKDILPEPVWNRRKMGFTFPFQNWLGSMQPVRSSLLEDKAGQDLLYSFDNGRLHWSKLWVYYLSVN